MFGKAHVRNGSERPLPLRSADWLVLAIIVLAVSGAYFLLRQPVKVSETDGRARLSESSSRPSDMSSAMSAPEDLPTDFASLVHLGNRQMDADDYPLAAECYRRALEIDSLVTDVRVDFGACLHAMGFSRRAIEEFRTVLMQEPEHAIAYYNLGIAYHTLGQDDSARICWHQCLSLDPGVQLAAAARELLEQVGD